MKMRFVLSDTIYHYKTIPVVKLSWVIKIRKMLLEPEVTGDLYFKIRKGNFQVSKNSEKCVHIGHNVQYPIISI
jgi:hypothetical protein